MITLRHVRYSDFKTPSYGYEFARFENIARYESVLNILDQKRLKWNYSFSLDETDIELGVNRTDPVETWNGTEWVTSPGVAPTLPVLTKNRFFSSNNTITSDSDIINFYLGNIGSFFSVDSGGANDYVLQFYTSDLYFTIDYFNFDFEIPIRLSPSSFSDSSSADVHYVYTLKDENFYRILDSDLYISFDTFRLKSSSLSSVNLPVLDKVVCFLEYYKDGQLVSVTQEISNTVSFRFHFSQLPVGSNFRFTLKYYLKLFEVFFDSVFTLRSAFPVCSFSQNLYSPIFISEGYDYTNPVYYYDDYQENSNVFLV